MNEDEKELGSFHTGIAIGDAFFKKERDVDSLALIPASFELITKCFGLIKESGTYALRLQLVKLK
jgi:hypothetical protein